MSKQPRLKRTLRQSITRSAAASAERIDLACSPDSDDVGTRYTHLQRLDAGSWNSVEIKQHAESLCQFRDASGALHLYVMSREGDLYAADDGGVTSKIEDPRLAGKPYRLSFLYKLRQIGDALYACGSGGQNYRSDNAREWKTMDEALFDGPYPDSSWNLEYIKNLHWFDDPEKMRIHDERMEQDSERLLWTLGGPGPAAIYMAGEKFRGVLHLWNGERAEALDLPSRKALREILIGPDGTVWICGRAGLLLQGRERSFELVADLGDEPRFASMAWFQDRLHLCSSSSTQGLFTLEGRRIQPLLTGLSPEPTEIHTLEAVDGVLWAVGLKCLLRFDGTTWESITVPVVND